MSLEQWKNVDIFDPNVQWQKDLALLLVDTCKSIVGRWSRPKTELDRCEYEVGNQFHSDDKSYYEDKVVIITIDNSYVKDYSSKIETWFEDIRVRLVSSETVILSAIKTKVRYGDPIPYGFSSVTDIDEENVSAFWIGSWLDHIEALRIKFEQDNLQRSQEQRKIDEENRLKSFGRID